MFILFSLTNRLSMRKGHTLHRNMTASVLIKSKQTDRRCETCDDNTLVLRFRHQSHRVSQSETILNKRETLTSYSIFSASRTAPIKGFDRGVKLFSILLKLKHVTTLPKPLWLEYSSSTHASCTVCVWDREKWVSECVWVSEWVSVWVCVWVSVCECVCVSVCVCAMQYHFSRERLSL